MARVKSVFGQYAEELQVMFDSANERFDPLFFPQYFDWGVPKATLDFTTVIGRSRIEAMASVISRDSSAPLRSRALLEKLQGSIPVIKEKFKLTEDDYRQWLSIQSLRGVNEQTKLNMILDLIWGDAKKAAQAPLKRIDAMCLEAISTGEITINVANNPDGVALSAAIDLGMPNGNKKNAAVNWATSASAKPITDIMALIRDAEDKGRSFSKMLMTRATFWKMAATAEVVDVLKGYFNYASKNIPTFDQVNQYLSNNLLPQIEIVDFVTGVEKDGKIAAYRPFKEEHVSFLPQGKLGIVHHALAMEQIAPVNQVSYAVANKVLVSKWGENDPFAEFTMGELNAFPGVEAIDSIFLLNTAGA
jgi:hypothetical protein